MSLILSKKNVRCLGFGFFDDSLAAGQSKRDHKSSGFQRIGANRKIGAGKFVFAFNLQSVGAAAPLILAPIFCSMAHRSWTCGSAAAISIVVLPLAVAASIITISVPMTENSFKAIIVPSIFFGHFETIKSVFFPEFYSEFFQSFQMDGHRPDADLVAARMGNFECCGNAPTAGR